MYLTLSCSRACSPGFLLAGVPKDGDCFYSSICQAVAMGSGAAPPPAIAGRGSPGGASSSYDDDERSKSPPPHSPSLLLPPAPLGAPAPPGPLDVLPEALPLTVAGLRDGVAAAATDEQLRFYQIFAEAK